MKKTKWLALADRRKIEEMYGRGLPIQEIADKMQRNRATIYREIRKGETGEMDANGRLGYSADIAQKRAYTKQCEWRGMTAATREER